MNAIGKHLVAIYDGKESAMSGLERLVKNSAALARALSTCRAMSDPRVQEMLAQNFLNCYCAGFVAGIDFTKEASNGN